MNNVCALILEFSFTEIYHSFETLDYVPIGNLHDITQGWWCNDMKEIFYVLH